MSLRSSTQFRRSGQRDDRRRRLLSDDLTMSRKKRRRSRSAAAGEELPTRKSENYGDAEFMEESARLIDLVPRRLSTFVLLLAAGLVIVAGLELLYSYAESPELKALTHDGTIAALDLDSEGSLAVWFSSTTLSLAALAALLVYTVRRHKTDDYHGYYRVWLWAAACWLLMSIDETSSLHEGFKELMACVTGNRLHGDGSIWWVIPYFFLLGAVGSRLLVDMWPARLSTAALLGTAGCYATAVATQLLTEGEGGARMVMLEEGAEMVGNLLLLMAMGLHARYVILDAQGLLPRREPKPLEEDEEEAEALEEEAEEEEYEEEEAPAEDQWITVDAAHETPHPKLKRRSRKRRRQPETEPEEVVFEPDPEPEPIQTTVKRKLTKAEKKALRRRLAKERLERERKQTGNW